MKFNVEVYGETLQMTEDDLIDKAAEDLDWASEITDITDDEGNMYGISWNVSIVRIPTVNELNEMIRKEQNT